VRSSPKAFSTLRPYPLAPSSQAGLLRPLQSDFMAVALSRLLIRESEMRARLGKGEAESVREGG
jgi:hypothetical protein